MRRSALHRWHTDEKISRELPGLSSSRGKRPEATPDATDLDAAVADSPFAVRRPRMQPKAAIGRPGEVGLRELRPWVGGAVPPRVRRGG